MSTFSLTVIKLGSAGSRSWFHVCCRENSSYAVFRYELDTHGEVAGLSLVDSLLQRGLLQSGTRDLPSAVSSLLGLLVPAPAWSSSRIQLRVT